MKKGIIVLLIAVLVSGFAFAEVTKFKGFAQLDYSVGLNKGDEFGFANKQKTKFEFSFEFATADKEKTEHQTDFWAEIAAYASAGYIENEYVLSAEITMANIHLKDFTINILGPNGPYDYAKSFTEDAYGIAIFDYSNNRDNQFYFDYGHGIEIRYQDYSVSFAQYKKNTPAVKASTTYGSLEWYEYDPSDDYNVYEMIIWTGPEADAGYYALVTETPASDAMETLFIYGGLQTKTFGFGENMTFKAAVNALVQGDKNAEGKYALGKNVGMAFDFEYTTDTVTGSVAADVDYGQTTFNTDILATGEYDFVSGGIYFGLSKAKDADANKVLEAFIKAAIPVGDYTINVYAEADRLFLNKKTEDVDWNFSNLFAGYTFKADTTIGRFTLGTYFDYNQIVDTLTFWGTDYDQYGMDVGVDITFRADKFTVKGGAALTFDEEYVDKWVIKPYAVKPYASISTVNLVENCTLSLGWAKARFIVMDSVWDKYMYQDNGRITATAKIEF